MDIDLIILIASIVGLYFWLRWFLTNKCIFAPFAASLQVDGGLVVID